MLKDISVSLGTVTETRADKTLPKPMSFNNFFPLNCQEVKMVSQKFLWQGTNPHSL